jgi:tRNA 2-thiouridine synthesizing protein A
MPENHKEVLLDLSGLLCPLPVLKARKRLLAMKTGEILVVTATDPMAAIDIPHFCLEQGHALLAQETDGKALAFRIRKG